MIGKPQKCNSGQKICEEKRLKSLKVEGAICAKIINMFAIGIISSTMYQVQGLKKEQKNRDSSKENEDRDAIKRQIKKDDKLVSANTK